MSDTNDSIKYLCCFRLQAWAVDYDEELIWAFVQRHRGFMNIRNDAIDFWIHEDYQSLFVLAWPELTRLPALDYVE